MKKIVLLCICVLLCLNCLPVMCAPPAVVSLYVSPENGNDRYSGSEQYPFATLEKALRTAQLLEEKTMIYLREGVYPGGLLLDQSASRLMLRRYPGERVEFQAASGRPALSLTGCSQVSVQGIAFSGGSGAVIRDCQLSAVYDCEFSNMEQGVRVEGDVRLEGNVIRRIRGGALTLSSGVQESLQPGQCIVTHNTIENYGKNGLGTAGVRISGVGVVFSHNTVRDAAGCAVEISGNEHRVQNNAFERIDAAGAVCTQGNVASRGTEIRNNRFTDCTETGIVLNEFSSGITMVGNVFYRLNRAAQILGGRNHTFQENVSISCGASLSIEKEAFPYEKRQRLQEQLNRLPNQELWLERYPELKNLMKDQPGLPKYNRVSGNYVFETPVSVIADAAVQNGEIGSDTVLQDKGAFADFDAGDFTLEGGPDCTRMGSRQEELQAQLAGCIVLKVDRWLALNHGAAEAVDADNHKVTPAVRQDRTLVPIRFVAEQLGATVTWNGAAETVLVKKGKDELLLTVGSKTVRHNGEQKELDVAPVVEQSRTLVPLRAIAEGLSMEVSWDDAGWITIGEQPAEWKDEFMRDALNRIYQTEF